MTLALLLRGLLRSDLPTTPLTRHSSSCRHFSSSQLPKTTILIDPTTLQHHRISPTVRRQTRPANLPRAHCRSPMWPQCGLRQRRNLRPMTTSQTTPMRRLHRPTRQRRLMSPSSCPCEESTRHCSPRGLRRLSAWSPSHLVRLRLSHLSASTHPLFRRQKSHLALTRSRLRNPH